MSWSLHFYVVNCICIPKFLVFAFRGWWTPVFFTSALTSAKFFMDHVSRRNTLTQARRNISRHYDLVWIQKLLESVTLEELTHYGTFFYWYSVPVTLWLWALTLNEQKLTIFLWSVSRAMNSLQFSWMKQWHTHVQCSRQEQVSDAWVRSSYQNYFSNFCSSSS